MFEKVKGLRDFLPEEALKREKVLQIIKKWFKIYGFLPLETPTIEYEDLLKLDNPNDEIISEIFKLKDRGGRELALRYEFTVQLSRLLKENQNIRFPFRRYQIGSVFRDEPTKPGRYREFVQCDVDIIGSSDISSDIECLLLTKNILEELKISYQIKVNNRQLLNEVLESLGIKLKEKVLREIDKKNKISDSEVKRNLKRIIGDKKVKKLFSLLKKPLSYFVKNNFMGAKDLSLLINLCKKAGVKVKFVCSMVRGLSYYTGNIFEVKSPKAKFTIAAGGRFDDKVGKFLNRKIPAVGLSFGLDRVSEIAKVEVNKPKVIICSLDSLDAGIKLLGVLRTRGIPCFSINKLKKALSYASSEKIPFLVIIGKEEIKKGKYKLKDMKKREEEMVSSSELIKKLTTKSI